MFAEIQKRYREAHLEEQREYIRKYKTEYYKTEDGREKCIAAAHRWLDKQRQKRKLENEAA